MKQEEIDSNEQQNRIRIQAFYCDVASASSVQQAVDKAVQSFGTPHLLWNNAGYQGQIMPTLQYSIDDFATVMNINVTGMFIVLQTVAKYMAAATATETATTSSQHTSHNYSIVNTASVAALRGTPAMIAYASSKAAVLAMTVAAAKGSSFIQPLHSTRSFLHTLISRVHLIQHIFLFIYRSGTPWDSCQRHQSCTRWTQLYVDETK